MPGSLIDPASLEGDDLTRWYLRAPDDIERERQARGAQRYREFFGPSGERDVDPGFAIRPQLRLRDVDPGFAIPAGQSGHDIDPGFDAVPTGPNRWRIARADSAGKQQSPLALPGSRSSSTTTGANATSADPPSPTVRLLSQRPDPNKTDVFQPGADGKLHPIAGWHTTGPFDFPTWSHDIDWKGVGKDLGNIASGVADFTGAGAVAETVVKHLGYDVGGAVIRGIVQGHHPWPRFMGGPAEQELARLHRSLHTKFHSQLGAALKEAGFPRVGGVGGATEDWAAHFKLNPESFDKAVGVLRDTTRQFDRKNGTWISKYLDRTLPEAKPPARSPGR